jgi:dihydroxyacid dehydratase/phosphogluconate dehydratase
MATALEILGVSPTGWNGVPALDPHKPEVSVAAGRLVMELLSNRITA